MDRANFERLLKAGAFQDEEEGTPNSLRPADFTDTSTAQVFAREKKGKLVYTKALGWLCWDGKRWEASDLKAAAHVMEFTGNMLQEAKKNHEDALHRLADTKAQLAVGDATRDDVTNASAEVKDALAFLNHAMQSRSKSRSEAILMMSRPYLAIEAEKLDANPEDLNTPIGIIDLATGKLRPHTPAALCSHMTSAAPGTAGADMWIAFLETVTDGDNSLMGFLQLVAGMALHGKVYHEGMILAYGSGRNGKSTFWNALLSVLGDYAGTIDVGILTTDRQNRGAALATLRGKRLVVAGELEEGKRLSVATVKQICSTDKITIEEKYKAPESVTPSHSLVLYTNYLPRVGSMDNGTWRRLQVVPFNAKIPAGKAVANFGDVLVAEAGPAILAWAIEGAVNFARNGHKLDIPAAVEEVTDTYRQRENWLDNFLDECCVREPNARAGAAELYSTYKEWAASNGDYERRMTDFNAAMEAAGYQKISPKNRKTWVGVRVGQRARYSQAM
ncbi:phage/plasmid primase, P4 family [Dysosmobacter sp.]|uniref:DNA primase family protein n=1 Tax=Dysosmobacter sp. TaxID=2591382 RepID=UPI00261E45F6|nr:DNA primase family protein [Dysosmobacter sp.]